MPAAGKMAESAFIVRVSEAEPYVGRYRERFDPSARLGVPAHVTILFPFMPPEALSEEVFERARAVAASVPEFQFSLARLGRFPGTLYLAPEPAAPFVALTESIHRSFPEYPPYGGKHSSVVPHMTIAHASDPEQDKIEAELRENLPHPPCIAAICKELVLIENSSGRWRELRAFALGSRSM